LSGTTLSLSLENDGVAANTVDLSSLQDGTGTDDQILTLSGTNLTIESGNTVDLSTITTVEIDGDTTNEIQTLSFSNDTLYLTDGGSVDLSSLSIEEIDGDTTNELNTDFIISNDSLHLTDAGGTLSVLLPSPLLKVQTLTSSGTVNADTDVLLVDPGTATTVSIPAIGTGVGEFPEGYELKIKRTTAAGNAITLDPAGTQTIDGQATRTLNIGYQSMTLVATSTGWFIID